MTNEEFNELIDLTQIEEEPIPEAPNTIPPFWFCDTKDRFEGLDRFIIETEEEQEI